MEPSRLQYNGYIVGIGLGTLLGNALFIFGGKLLVGAIKNSSQYINWVIGGVFTITALLQLWKMLQNKNAIKKMENIKDEDVDHLKLKPH